ncbi:hypothetical protein [Actinomadura sp. CNU-125]|uniref:hypothetical protein n=1 Tax=Actinomadura sp. CNU-125 TaxID=1904961 RepID=UPI0021CD1127|nr:hypothetical protein [Actinomadura sp. CNU-125]
MRRREHDPSGRVGVLGQRPGDAVEGLLRLGAGDPVLLADRPRVRGGRAAERGEQRQPAREHRDAPPVGEASQPVQQVRHAVVPLERRSPAVDCTYD